MEEPSDQTSASTPLQNWTQTQNNTFLPLFSSTLYYDILLVSIFLISPIALLGMCCVVYGIYSLVKMNQSSSVFVMNLFICDLIQTFSKLMQNSAEFIGLFLDIKKGRFELYSFQMFAIYFYIFGVIVNVCFMVCISAERYIIIAHPVWYRTKQTTRKLVFMCVTVWVTAAIVVIILCLYSWTGNVLIALFLLLPYPLVIFFLVGTWRALSKSTVPHNDQRRIMGILALILCIYTVLFLPFVLAAIWSINLIQSDDFYKYYNSLTLFLYVAYILMALNPLFDFLLYLLMRKDAKDLLCARCVCCQRRQEEHRDTDTQRSPTLEGVQV